MGLVGHGSTEFVKDFVGAPHVSAVISTLGGHASLMIAISLDAKDLWANGIFENSRYCRVKIDDDGRCEMFVDQLFGIIPWDSGLKRPFNRMRKWKSKDLQHAVDKINGYLNKCRDHGLVSK